MDRLEQIVDAADALTGEASGGDVFDSLSFLTGVASRAEAAALLAEGINAARDRLNRGMFGDRPRDVARDSAALITGIELGVAAERSRARSAS